MFKRITALTLCLILAVSLLPSVRAFGRESAAPESVDRCCQTLREEALSPNYHRPAFAGKLIDITPQRVADTFAYLDAHYVQNHPEQALAFYTGTEADRENLKKLAQIITADCTTDTEKADAIGRWISGNISYDILSSAYATDTFYRREGNCLSYANLMMFLLRALGIPAVVGDGWRGDMKEMGAELFSMEGHAWVFVRLDGQWVLYDPLWLDGGTTDRDYMAQWIYFDTVEMITPACDGENLPPKSSEVPLPFWTNGKYYLYSNVHPTGSGTLSYFVNNQTYVFVSNQCEPEGSQDGRLYIDGRDKSQMTMGELYRDGWVSYGEYHNNKSMAHTYAFPNGMMADGYTMEFDGKLWYMSYDSAVPILMDEGDYWIQDGLVTMAPGYTGPWLGLRWQDGCFESSIGEVFLTHENLTPEVATVDDSGNITCHAEGYAEFRYKLQRRERNGNITLMGSALTQVFVSSEDRTPDYRDLSSHEHDMQYQYSTEPTCEGWGMDIYKCSGCAYTEESYAVQPLGHDYQYSHTTPPTCDDYGYNHYTCTRCGDSYDSAEIDMLGHDYVRSVFAEATCTEMGYGYYECARCDAEYLEADTPALGHDLGEWTLLEPGIEVRSCSRCDYREERTAEQHDHTCGENAVWSFADGTLTISGTGSTYDYLETVEGGADVQYPKPWEMYSQDILRIVVGEGITRLGNDIFRNLPNLKSAELPDTLLEIGYFAFLDCGALESAELPSGLTVLKQQCFHGTALTAVEIPASVSFVDAGVFNYCTALKTAYFHTDPDQPGFVVSDSIFQGCTALEEITVEEGHLLLKSIDGALYVRMRGDEELHLNSYPLGRKNTELRLPNATVSIGVSSLEGARNLERVIVPAKVTAVGFGAFADCAALKEVLFEGDAPAFAQLCFWNCDLTVYYPTDAEGWEIRDSLEENWLCGENGSVSWDSYTPAHTHSYLAEITAPTCTEQGYTTYTCSCGERYTADYTDALGHDLTDWIITKDPTCTETGLEERWCQRCELRESREVSAAGHSYEATVTAPTCTEQGYTTYTCSCGEGYEADYTDALGHDWQGIECARCGAVRENPFADVPDTGYYFEPVLWALEQGITNGTAPGTFSPDAPCNRAQVVTFLWRAAGQPEPVTTVNPFADVVPGSFYEKAVLWAVENGITNGIDATHFGPNEICNRAAVVTFLWRTGGQAAPNADSNPFRDVPAGCWYEAPVLWALENGITNGISAEEFGATAPCNRAQVVTFLYRYFRNAG